MIAKQLRAAVRAGADGDPIAAARYAISFAGTGISVPSATELRRALGRSTGLLVDTGADVRQAVADELRAHRGAVGATMPAPRLSWPPSAARPYIPARPRMRSLREPGRSRI